MPENEVCKGRKNFISKLLKLVFRKVNENMIISPKLLQMSIGIVLFGTVGEEACNIRKFLCLELNNNYEVACHFHELFANRRICPLLNFSLNIFPNVQYEFYNAYNELVKMALHVKPEFVDFENSAEAAEHVNCWARYATGNRIKRIVGWSVFDKDTSLVLVGTSILKAYWRIPFDPANTTYGRFALDELRSIPVEMMTAYDKFRVGDVPELDAKVLELEFAFSDISMFIFMPKTKGGLRKMNKIIARSDLSALCENLLLKKILVHLPKFITEFQIELTDYVREMGLSSIFSDYPKFDLLLKNNKQVNVSNIFQKIVISINEAGSEVKVEDNMKVYQAAVVGSSTNNVVVSPMALRTSLSLAYFGAEGSTEAEIRKYLYLPSSKQHVADKLQNINDPSKSGKVFVMANKISVPKNIPIKQEFVDKIKCATLEPPLVQDFTMVNAAISQLNHIMSVLTNGKFQDVVNTDNLDNARIILLSAIYLKAKFTKPFPLGSTELDKFWVNGTTAVEVQMMHTIDNFRFCELPSLKARVVAIPFHLEHHCMLIFLPDSKTGFKDVEHNLKDVEVFGLAQGMTEKIINIKLPKFHVDFHMNCMSAVPKLGFKEIFSNSANFKSISEESKICVSHIYHSAQINLNESGAEGGVPTDFTPVSNWTTKGDQIKFFVDRPFIFVVKDHKTVHFVGRIVKP